MSLKKNGLRILFILTVVIIISFCFVVSVERYVVEQRGRSITVGVDYIDYLLLLKKAGKKIEDGINLLLSTGVDSFEVRSFSLRELEKLGEVTIVSKKQIIDMRRMGEVFPELFLNISPVIRKELPESYYIISKDESLIKQIDDGVKILYSSEIECKRIKLDNGVSYLKINYAPSTILDDGVYFDLDRCTKLIKIGFKLYYKFPENKRDVMEIMNGRLDRAIRDRIISGIILCNPENDKIKMKDVGIIYLGVEKKLLPIKLKSIGRIGVSRGVFLNDNITEVLGELKYNSVKYVSINTKLEFKKLDFKIKTFMRAVMKMDMV